MGGIQLGHRLHDGQCGSHRTFGIVLVGRRRAEDCREAGACGLFKCRSVPQQLVPDALLIGTLASLDVLWIDGCRGVSAV